MDLGRVTSLLKRFGKNIRRNENLEDSWEEFDDKIVVPVGNALEKWNENYYEELGREKDLGRAMELAKSFGAHFSDENGGDFLDELEDAMRFLRREFGFIVEDLINDRKDADYVNSVDDVITTLDHTITHLEFMRRNRDVDVFTSSSPFTDLMENWDELFNQWEEVMGYRND